MRRGSFLLAMISYCLVGLIFVLAGVAGTPTTVQADGQPPDPPAKSDTTGGGSPALEGDGSAVSFGEEYVEWPSVTEVIWITVIMVVYVI